MAEKHEWGKKRVRQILRQVPGPSNQIWVAGSAAIKPTLASDIDIWLLKGYGLIPKLQSTLESCGWKPTFGITYGEPLNEYPEQLVQLRYDFVAEDGIKIQLMVTVMESIMDILDQFDLSVHAHARSQASPKTLVSHPKATLPGEPIRWIKNPTGGAVCSGRMVEMWKRYETAPLTTLHPSCTSPAETLEEILGGANWEEFKAKIEAAYNAANAYPNPAWGMFSNPGYAADYYTTAPASLGGNANTPDSIIVPDTAAPYEDNEKPLAWGTPGFVEGYYEGIAGVGCDCPECQAKADAV